MATPTYAERTAVEAKKVERVHPVAATLHGLAKNRVHVFDDDEIDGDSRVGDTELTTTQTSRSGCWVGFELRASIPIYHGEVPNSEGMLALHNWDNDPGETVLYIYVVSGDWCTRADDPGAIWVCRAGHGTAIEHWERRLLPDGVDARIANATAALANRVTDLESAVEEISSEIPIASASTLGGVKIGSGLEISADGVLSATGAGAVVLSWLATDWISDYVVGSVASLGAGIGWDGTGVALAATRATDWLDALAVGLHSSIATGSGWAAAGAALT